MDVYDRMADDREEVDPAGVAILVSLRDAMRAAVTYLNGVKPNESDWVEVARR